MGQAKRRPTKIRPKAVGCGISTVFSNFEKYRPEVADDVISVRNKMTALTVFEIFGEKLFRDGGRRGRPRTRISTIALCETLTLAFRIKMPFA